MAGDKAAWDWPFYRPLIELALEHDLPLKAANLPRDHARSLTKGAWSAVFTSQMQHRLGLDGPLPDLLQVEQEQLIDLGHCGALPRHLLPGMARAQMARDALMAQVVREQCAAMPDRGLVLVAGNGHVRRDLGVPRWLGDLGAGRRLWVVGFVEPDDAALLAMFDMWMETSPAKRPDLCERFKVR